MATRQAAVSNNLQLQLDGQWHKLSVTVRHDVGVEQGQLVRLVKSTVGLWCKAWQAVNAPEPMRDFNMQSACFQHEIEPCAGDPYVTVWNMGNGISLTVHSHTDGASAVMPFFAYQDALDAMIEVKPEMFSLSQPSQASIPTNITQYPQQAPANNSPVNFKVWSRSTIPGLADGLLGFESGKVDNPNYDKQAIIATVPYDWQAVQFDKKYSFAAYPITGKVIVKDFDSDGVMSIGIETTADKTIWVKDRGGEHNYDWMAVTKKLGIDSQLEALTDGIETTIQADYVVMSLSKPTTNKDGADVQYKNFYGFFNAPEQAELQATGTEGAPQATDSTGKEWLDQKIADMPNADRDTKGEQLTGIHNTDDIPF